MGQKMEDLTGQKFGRLTAVEFKGQDKYGTAKWLCQCDCGGQKIVNKRNLKNGMTKSCGCLQAEQRKGWSEAGKNYGKTKEKNLTLCISCIRSAAPPELQCIWDASKGQELPAGAESKIDKDKICIISCPKYLSMCDAANIALLREARQRNDKRITKEFAERCISY